MNKKKIVNFVDELMERVFSQAAPAMPDFSTSSREANTVQELKDEELDFLNAAGVSRCNEQRSKHEKK